jgi:hypothetical protein
VSVDNGYFLAKNDTLFWQKLLNRKPEHSEAMYYVALELEKKAKINLERFYSTSDDIYWTLYRRGIRDALVLMKRSLGKGHFAARTEVLRIEEELRSNEKRLAALKAGTVRTKKTLIYVLLSAIIVLLLLIAFLIYKGSSATYINNHHFTYMLPYEVIEERPFNIPKADLQPLTLQVKSNISKQLLANQLMETLKQDYERSPSSAKLVVAVNDDHMEVGMAYWADEEKGIKVYIYPPDNSIKSSDAEKNRQLWETTTIIRSALYQFVKKNGYMPRDLTMLTHAFPNNYLSEFPQNPYNMKNDVTTSPEGDAGWLFSPLGTEQPTDLISAVREALKPSTPKGIDIPFTPLQITIDKANHKLLLMSGDKLIRRFSVALGKDNLTPEGSLWITKRVANPDKGVPQDDNVYGTRAMELSNPNYAIHGTNSPGSIGRDVSLGCIRLVNPEMEDLYTLTPLYTAVNITKELNPEQNTVNLAKTYLGLYGPLDLSKEEDLTRYYWGG